MTTITLTQEQFNELVNKTAESAKSASKKGIFGKILGFIVDHFFGIIQILAVIAVAYIFLFNPEFGKTIVTKINDWISDIISNTGTNIEKIKNTLAKPIVSKDAKDKWTSKSKDATHAMSKSFLDVGEDFVKTAEDMNNAAIPVHSTNTIMQNLGGAMKTTIQADWLTKMQDLYEELKAKKDPTCPKDVTGMTRWIKENRPDIYKAKLQAIRDATKDPNEFKGLDAYIKF